MAALRDFDRYVLPFVAGAPLPAIDDALIDASIEFCRRTYCINEDFILTVPANRASIAIDSTDEGLDPCAVLDVYGPKGKLDVMTKPKLVIKWPDGWQTKTADRVDDLYGWIQLSEKSFRLTPYLTVRAEKALRVTCAMRPTVAATTLPDLLLARWPEQIAHGALARLHAHEKAPYAMPERIGMHLAAFNAAMSFAGDEVESGFNRPHLRTGLDEFA